MTTNELMLDRPLVTDTSSTDNAPTDCPAPGPAYAGNAATPGPSPCAANLPHRNSATARNPPSIPPPKTARTGRGRIGSFRPFAPRNTPDRTTDWVILFPTADAPGNAPEATVHPA